MPDIKTVKPRTMLIVGVVSSIVLVIVVCVVIFLVLNAKKSTSKKPVPTTKQPSNPVGNQEVYLMTLSSFMKGGTNTFKPTYPNLNLATKEQIQSALTAGLGVCATGFAKDNNGTEIMIDVTPGAQTFNANLDSCKSKQGITILPSSLGSDVAWIYGVKPPNGTPGILAFSRSKWSQYN